MHTQNVDESQNGTFRSRSPMWCYTWMLGVDHSLYSCQQIVCWYSHYDSGRHALKDKLVFMKISQLTAKKLTLETESNYKSFSFKFIINTITRIWYGFKAYSLLKSTKSQMWYPLFFGFFATL